MAKKKMNTPSSNNSILDTDKLVRELEEKASKTLTKYNTNLLNLQNFFTEEPPIITDQHINSLKELKNLIGIENPTLFKKIASKTVRILAVFLPWMKKKLRIQNAIYTYLNELTDTLTTFKQHEANFRNEQLKYYQQIAPLIYNNSSVLSRQVTAMPVERMDLVFIELKREIEQLKTDVEKLKK